MLTSLLKSILELFYGISGNYALSIMFLSLSVSIIMMPLFWISEKIQGFDRKKKEGMLPALDEIKDLENSQEKYFYTREIYSQHKYHPAYALLGLTGLLIQIPFFIAAYKMLGHYALFEGQSFALIKDLSVPDGLIRLDGMIINLLPFIMTAINLLAGYLYTINKDKDKNEQLQLVGISLLFLVLLYKQPAALVFYWTMNNIFAIGKNYVLASIMKKGYKRTPLVPNQQAYQPIIHEEEAFTISKTARSCSNTASSYYSQVIPVEAGRQKNSPKQAFMLNFFYNTLIMIFLLAFILAKGKTEHETSIVAKQLLMFFSVFMWMVHIPLCKHFLVSLKTRIRLLQAVVSIALTSIAMIIIIIAFVSGIIPKAYVGEAMAFGIVLEYIGIYMMFSALFRLLYKQSWYHALLHIFKKSNKRNQSIKNNGMQFAIFLLSLTILFVMTFINNPIVIFNTEPSFFAHSIDSLLPLLIKMGIFMVLMMLLLYIIKPLRNILAYGVCVLMLISWIYAYIYTPYIGIMDGMVFRNDADLFRSVYINVLEFISTLVLAIYLIRFMMKQKTLVLVINVLALGIIVIASSQNYHKFASENQINNQTGTNTTQVSSLPDTHQTDFSFSNDQENIIVILFDGFVGPLASKIFREYPEIKEKFDGFHYFRNTIASASYTFGSLLSMLHGKDYTPSNYNTFKSSTYKNLDYAYAEAFAFLPDLLNKDGYKSYFHNPEWTAGANGQLTETDYFSMGNNNEYYDYWQNESNISIIKKDTSTASNALLILSLFKNLPYFGKPLFYKFLKIERDEVVEDAFIFASHQIPILNLFPLLINNNSSDKTFKFFHLLTTHGPYSIDKNIKLLPIYDKAYNHSNGVGHYYHLIYSLRAVGKWIEALQKMDIYDNTKIIIISDHGFNDQQTDLTWWDEIKTEQDEGFVINKGAISSVLMIKDFDSRGNVVYDNKPMESSDLPYLITKDIPNAEDVYRSIEGTRKEFEYQNVKTVPNHATKKKFIFEEQSKIKYDEATNIMYYQMDDEDTWTPLYLYGEE